MEREVTSLRQTRQGARNDTLNKAAFRLGTPIGVGHLDRSITEVKRLEAAIAIGLGQSESQATIRSGLVSGTQHPRQL